MTWTIQSTKNDEAWLSDYIADVIAYAPPALPGHDLKIGHVDTHWHQVAPGLVYLAANPDQGSIDDRIYAQRVVWSMLSPFGFKRAGYKEAASWGVSPKVEADAKRLVQSGAVHLDVNSQGAVVATVQGDGTDNDGDPDTHKVEIQFQDPNDPQKVTGIFCDCKWGQFMNTPRTRQFKRFQPNGRPIPCKHCIATFWLSQSVPKDESRAPGDQGEEGQMSLPGMDMSGGDAPSSMGLMQRSEMPDPSAWFTQPGAPPNQWQQMNAPSGAAPQQTQAPPPESVLPQFPMDPSLMPQVNPASIPGGRPGPTPTNPIQYPGGTFSSVHTAQQPLKNGDLVRLKQDTLGNYVGRPESGMPGQQVPIQKGQPGHVRGVEASTGMVEVLFMGDQFNAFGPLQPFGATAWCWPSELEYIPPDAPGAALKRLW